MSKTELQVGVEVYRYWGYGLVVITVRFLTSKENGTVMASVNQSVTYMSHIYALFWTQVSGDKRLGFYKK